MTSLPYEQTDAEELYRKVLKLNRLHQELSSYYRAGSTDRRTMGQLWYLIDGLELDLRSRGVKL